MKFEDFVKKSGNKVEHKPEGVVIDGTFGCHHCEDMSDEAEYFPAEKFVRWDCVNGHVSYIEDFKLW